MVEQYNNCFSQRLNEKWAENLTDKIHCIELKGNKKTQMNHMRESRQMQRRTT